MINRVFGKKRKSIAKKVIILSTILLLSHQGIFTAEGKTFAKRPQLESVVSFKSKNEDFALSPDGRTLAMTNSDQLTILDLGKKDCKELRALAPNDDYKYFTAVSFADNNRLLVTSSCPEIWDLKTKTCLWVVQNTTKVCHAQLSPDGKNLLTVEETTATVWNIKEKKPLYVLETIKSLHVNTHNSFFWNPNGELIALPLSKDNAIGVWNHQNSKALHILSGHTKPVISVAFSPHQTMLATASFDKTIRLYCLETGNCLNVLEGHTKLCANMFFTKDEQQVITPLVDGTVRVWDPQTGQCLKVLEGHEHVITTSAFCPKTGILATGSQDETVRIWDVNTGELLQIVPCSGRVDQVAFDERGETLAIGSGKFDTAVMTIQVLAILPTTYFELLDSMLHKKRPHNETLKERLSALREKEQDKKVTIERLWQLFGTQINSPEFDVDKAQLLLRQLEYLKVVIPEHINELMLKRTPPEKLFPLFDLSNDGKTFTMASLGALAVFDNVGN
jgi:WD40 repeat protein